MSKPSEKDMQIVCEALFRMIYGEKAGAGSRKFGVVATKRWIHSALPPKNWTIFG